MAKAIDLPITGLESDKSWERYKGSRVREYLQKKVGAFYRPDKRQDDNAYHLLGFETEETKADWLKRWQAAVDAGDDAAMSALWTDKLIIQNTSLGGNTDIQNSVELITGSNQSSLVSIGIDIITLLSDCIDSNIKLSKLTITNVNITNLDHTILEYIADIPEVSITGNIKVTGNLTLDTVRKLQSKFGDINSKSNPLYIDYTKYEIASVTLTGKKYFDAIGTYKLGYSINPSYGNNLVSMVWSINTNRYATINADTGEITVNSLGTEKDKTKITVTLTINTIDGSAITDSKDVYLYKHTLQLGDIVFADGTYSDTLDPDKTAIGVCFYISDNLRLMCSLDNCVGRPWGLTNYRNKGIVDITLADSTEDVYDTPMTNIDISGISYNNITEISYVNTNGEFKEFGGSTSVGQLGTIILTESMYNVYASYFKKLGYSPNDYIPYGLYNTIVIIAHRNNILRDSNVNLEVPEAINDKSEATVLQELLSQISIDKGANYEQYYYPAASECYAYQPHVKEGEVLLDKFKAHHWWLPSEGELARMYYYHSHGYDITKEDAKAIFAKAYNLGILKQFDSNYEWSSTESTYKYAWMLDFKSGNVDGLSNNLAFKSYKYSVRFICAF